MRKPSICARSCKRYPLSEDPAATQVHLRGGGDLPDRPGGCTAQLGVKLALPAALFLNCY